MAFTRARTIQAYYGFSREQKPMRDSSNNVIPKGSTLLEMDTGNQFIFDGEVQWYPVQKDETTNNLLKDILLELQLAREQRTEG